MAKGKSPPEARAAFVAAMVLVVLASLIDTAPVTWLLSPFIIVLAAFAILRARLADTMLVLMFLALVLENPAERPAAGFWETPFYLFGALILIHIKNVVDLPIPIGGMDIMLLLAIGVAVMQRRRRALSGVPPIPSIMVKLAYLSLAATLLAYLIGKIRGGADNSMAIWQADRVTYLPIVFLLFGAAFEGPHDYLRAGKVLLLSGVIRACQAMYVRAVVDVPPDPITGEPGMPYSTTHNDSITFAMTVVLAAAVLIERTSSKHKRYALMAIPILVGGMLANHRRMVWLQIILVLATIYLVTERNKIKKKLERYLLLASPLALVYVAVGWGSKAKIFKPVQVIRSAVDTGEQAQDASTLWREIENYNLIYTFKQFPVFGSGLGHPFWEIIPLPAVDYPMEPFIPHNSVLGVFAFYGVVGFIGLTSLWVAGVYLAIRAYYFGKGPYDKAAALVCFASVLVYLVQCFGDIGLGCWAGVFTVAASLATACRLAVASGAFTEAPRRTRRGVAKPAPATAGPVGTS